MLMWSDSDGKHSEKTMNCIIMRHDASFSKRNLGPYSFIINQHLVSIGYFTGASKVKAYDNNVVH
jgi:hypothetical protein